MTKERTAEFLTEKIKRLKKTLEESRSSSEIERLKHCIEKTTRRLKRTK